MKDLNDEIVLTINLMKNLIRGGGDDGAHSELQTHLYSLLELKRSVLQQGLVERSCLEPVTHDQDTHKMIEKLYGLRTDGTKPLTVEELQAGVL